MSLLFPSPLKNVSEPSPQIHHNHLLITVNLLFMSDCIKNRLVLVTTAGSATTGPLELSALGADIGPGRETNQH